MLLVWNQLAPAMTVQQVVGGGQRDLAPQANIHRSFDLANHQDAARLGLLEERGQKGHFLVARHVLVPAPTFPRPTAIWNAAGADKACSELADPTH